jgi:hypothetical protein
MKKMIRYTLIAALVAISFTSCKKDDAPTETSRIELLTSANWKLTSDQTKLGTGAWVESIGFQESCDLDNYLKFNSNNTAEDNEGATKCDPLDLQSYTRTWAFQNGETQILFYGLVWTIDELTSTRLTLSTSEELGNGTHYYKVGYTH